MKRVVLTGVGVVAGLMAICGGVIWGMKAMGGRVEADGDGVALEEKVVMVFELEVEADPGVEVVTDVQMEEVKSGLRQLMSTIGFDRVEFECEGGNVLLMKIEYSVGGVLQKVKDKLQVSGNFEVYKVQFERTYSEHNLGMSGPFYNADAAEGERWDVKGMEELLIAEKLFPVREFDDEGDQYVGRYIITTSRTPILSGSDVKYVCPDHGSGTQIYVELTADGGRKNREFTRNEMVTGVDQIAFVFNGECFSTPTLQAKELGAHFVISGMRDLAECRHISSRMMSPLARRVTLKAARRE